MSPAIIRSDLPPGRELPRPLSKKMIVAGRELSVYPFAAGTVGRANFMQCDYSSNLIVAIDRGRTKPSSIDEELNYMATQLSQVPAPTYWFDTAPSEVYVWLLACGHMYGLIRRMQEDILNGTAGIRSFVRRLTILDIWLEEVPPYDNAWQHGIPGIDI